MKGKEEMETAAIASASETVDLSFLVNKAIGSNYALAVWRLPGDKPWHLIITKQPMVLQEDALLEELPAGFMVAPFGDARPRTYLKADYHFTLANGALDHSVQLESNSSAWLQQSTKEAREHSDTRYYCLPYQPAPTSKDDFLSTVSDGIREIEKGTFEKVVPSRTMTTPLPPNFDLASAFQSLCDRNPNALVSLVSSAQTGTWIGASPELLVNVTDNTLFQTNALAATQPYMPDTDIKAVAWTQKDIEEQALVERYIVNCFKAIRLREFEEHGPKTVRAGNLLHLKTEFSVDMVATNFPQLGTVMLRLLHPTSAVCGVPMETALAFLQAREGYDRQFYCGYIGPVNFNNAINIFVNLRCAQLLEEEAILYAGAGITVDSIPEQEWSETQIKMNTLLDVLHGVK